jgi:uncharacterized protein
MSYRDKLNPNGPKKLLALDGGGIRGLITIEVLAKIEQILREKSGKPNLVLADYFDYIAGTSTGAVIGTLLSLGRSVGEIKEIYLAFGEMMFDKGAILGRFEKVDKLKRYTEMGANVLGNWVANKFKLLRLSSDYSEYPDEPMIAKLQELLGKNEQGSDVTFSSEKLKTLLMVVLSNASTDSPWPVSNNPRAKYNDPSREDCNTNIPLWQLVRASTAAPMVFPPQRIVMGKNDFVFVDGGITPYNNPAFQLFLQATLKPYHLEWATGEGKMLLVSIGTGLNPSGSGELKTKDMGVAQIVETVLGSQFNSAIYQQDLLCRAFGKCLEGDSLDSEVKELQGDTGPISDPLFTYARYNAALTRDGLNKLNLSHIQPEDVSKLDSIKFMSELCEVGKAVAEQKVRPEHFAGFEAT